MGHKGIKKKKDVVAKSVDTKRKLGNTGEDLTSIFGKLGNFAETKGNRTD